MFRHSTTHTRHVISTATLAALGLAFLITGCAGPRPATPPPHIPGYESLQEDFQGLDLTPLRHRRVVLDPGHGGFFRGAVGPNGLTEAEVNLGVALYLRGLLEWAGAEVWLTRTADSDYLSPADSSLASDLAMRVSLSDSLQPDVFLSIHHNSNAALDRTINETQTYYPLNDDGASLDLARAIHRHLVLNLEISPASIRPGNFHVLRNATVPAVLGEPAMISNPVMAGRLSLAASQRLEAEAYFLGLQDYFSGGLPTWSGAPIDTVFWGGPEDPDVLAWQFLPGDPANPQDSANSQDSGAAKALPGPDPALTKLTLDGQTVNTGLSPDIRTVTWQRPPDLLPIPHLLKIVGRNLAGRATPLRQTVLLPRAAPSLDLSITRAPQSDRGAVHWQGAHGGPLPTGRLSLAPGLEFPVGPNLPTWTLVEHLNSRWPGGEARFWSSETATTSQACAVTVRDLAPGQDLRLVMDRSQPFAPGNGWRTRLGLHAESPLVILDSTPPYWLEGAGILPMLDLAPSDPTRPRTVAAAAAEWQTVPLLPGLQGKVIVLDPAGGETDPDGAGPLGLRGADLNLAVAEQAAILLRGAGARIYLTRHDETLLPAVEKVRLSGQVKADLFLTVGRHEAGRARLVRHHPGSTVGSLWAQAAVRASALLPAAGGGLSDTCLSQESSAYLLRHTACPALEWQLDPPATLRAEMRQTKPGWQQAEARAILLSVVAISGHPTVFEHQLQPTALWPEIARLGGLPPEQIDWVLVDGNFPWSPLPPLEAVATLPDSLTSKAGPGLPGLLPRHLLEIHAANRWQLWLVTADQGQWQPTLLLDGERQNP